MLAEFAEDLVALLVPDELRAKAQALGDRQGQELGELVLESGRARGRAR